MRCINYVGVTCVNGNCPNALADDYPEYGYKHVTCEECVYYKGCTDCVFYGTDMCELINEKGEIMLVKAVKMMWQWRYQKAMKHQPPLILEEVPELSSDDRGGFGSTGEI